MAIVYIPSMHRDLTGGVDRFEVAGASVGELLNSLDAQCPGLQARLVQDGRLADGLQVAVDNVISARGLRTKVSPNSEVHFVPAIGGG